MATGQQSFDPDDYIRRDREADERRREQEMIDSRRALQEREAFQRRERQRSLERLMDVVNDPNIAVDQEMLKAINDPKMVMTRNGELARVERTGFGSGRFASQFSRGMGFDLPTPARKKKRRKNPKLAAAFREANARYRTKSGKLRKGRTQADIAKLAHRLLKRM